MEKGGKEKWKTRIENKKRREKWRKEKGKRDRKQEKEFEK